MVVLLGVSEVVVNVCDNLANFVFNENIKHSNKERIAYISIYNKNNQEVFTEIMKNLKQLENNNRIVIFSVW